VFDFVYELLQKIGYHHPIHPTEVHMPIGLVVGAFVFSLVGMKLRRPELRRAAHYCMVLALVWFFPTVIFGLMDWQQYYSGSWLHPIEMKRGDSSPVPGAAEPAGSTATTSCWRLPL
jgi:hypothetical protein